MVLMPDHGAPWPDVTIIPGFSLETFFDPLPTSAEVEKKLQSSGRCKPILRLKK
jgi:hypothetical protein